MVTPEPPAASSSRDGGGEARGHRPETGGGRHSDLSANTTGIHIHGVHKRYGDVIALDDVSLDVAAGEFVTLLGPSGSGKTTLLMALAGFVTPQHGVIEFGGQDITRVPPHRRRAGVVFQNYALFPHMDVGGNIGYPLRVEGRPRAEIAQRVAEVLQLVRLPGLESRRIHELSGGQQQRVALARAIVFRPRVLLMDEPLSALDKNLREHMQIEIRHLHEQLGTTTIAVTHDQREALTMSDRIVVMRDGRILQTGAPRAVYERPATRFVAEFLGGATFLPVVRRGGECFASGVALSTAEGADRTGGLLMLRPEKLELLPVVGGADIGRSGDPHGSSHSAEWNVFDATAREVIYQGDSAIANCTLADGHEVSVRLSTRSQAQAWTPSAGDPVRLGLHRHDTVLVADDSQHA